MNRTAATETWALNNTQTKPHYLIFHANKLSHDIQHVVYCAVYAMVAIRSNIFISTNSNATAINIHKLNILLVAMVIFKFEIAIAHIEATYIIQLHHIASCSPLSRAATTYFICKTVDIPVKLSFYLPIYMNVLS